MRKVLILGANPETVSLILKAKEMGCYTIVTDYNPNAYAKKYADQAENIDATNVDALEELATREKVDGILVGVAEALLPAYCDLCTRLKLPCFSSADKFAFMTRKDFFKNKCREFGVPTIREFTRQELEASNYPVIIKPVDSSSSKGIRVCQSEEQLENDIEYALSFSRSKQYLIEEYMTGDEVISYYVIQDGNPIFVAMCDRFTYKSQAIHVQLPTCYIYPSRYIDSYLKRTNQVVKNMIRGLGLQNGSIFFQCFVDKDGIVRIYEPGYRLNGAQEHIIVSRISKIDAKEMYINLALNGIVSDFDLAPLANPKPAQISCKLSPLVSEGTIAKLEGLEEIAEIPDVISVNPSYCIGDTVTGEGTLKQIISRFFIVSDSKKELIDTIKKIHSLLKVENVAGDNMLIGQFDPEIINKLY